MSDIEIITKLRDLLTQGKSAVLCTLIQKSGSGPRKEGAKMLIDSQGNVYGTIGGGEMERVLVIEALEALRKRMPRTMTFALGVEPKEGAIPIDSKCGGEVKIFMDVVNPNSSLIIVGSGHIGMPLARIAHEAGFKIIVVDEAHTATRERFPNAVEIYNGSFEDELEKINVTPFDLVAIVHGETEYELMALRRFLSLKPAYIGLLGSRKKAEEHKRVLRQEGFPLKQIEKISAPIGLDIGAMTPEEIAISIVAELIKVRRRSFQ